MSYSKKQADVILNADARWNILCGAVRSGKTWVSYDLILRRLVELPDGDRVMIGRTQQTLERNVLNPLRRKLGSSFVTHVNNKNTAYVAGKPFYVVGADNKEAVTKIQGLGLIYAYGDEIATWHEDVFQMLKSRLSDTGALFDGTSNPEYPTHWLKTDILDRTDLNVKQWSFHIDDNPFLSSDYVENLKKEYTGVFYDRYILGRWVKAEGLIYPMFDRGAGGAHVVPTIPRPYEQYQISIDYGTLNPLSMGLWGLYDGIWFRVKEFYHDGRKDGTKTDDEYYSELVKFAGELKIKCIIIDPSAASFITLIRRRNKFTVRTADNAVLDGIRNTATALKQGLIKFNDCCEATFKEFEIYGWDEKAQEDTPIKENDHAMDEIRYFVMTNKLALPKYKFF